MISAPGDTDASRTELGACLAVSGALRYTAPDTVQVFSQIVRTADRVHLWARWDTTSVDEAADRVATLVVGALDETRKAC